MKSSASKLKLSLLGLSLFGLLIACGPTNSSTENSFNNARSSKDKSSSTNVSSQNNSKSRTPVSDVSSASVPPVSTSTVNQGDEVLNCGHHKEIAVKTPSTCSMKGYTTHICLECGESIKNSEEDLLQHKYDYVYLTNASNGKLEERKLCVYCGTTTKGSQFSKANNKVAYLNAENVIDNNSVGYVVTSGSRIKAYPAMGYEFVKWSNGQIEQEIETNGSAIAIFKHKQTELPTISIDLANGVPLSSVKRDAYREATISAEDGDDIVSIPGTFKGRGNGSWVGSSNGKSGYTFKLDTKTQILGMKSKSKKWNLIACKDDQSLHINWTAYSMSHNVFSGIEWQTQTKFVQFYVNNEYRGAYMLTDPVKVEKNRLNIVSEDANGVYEYENENAGWLIEYDRYATSNSSDFPYDPAGDPTPIENMSYFKVDGLYREFSVKYPDLDEAQTYGGKIEDSRHKAAVLRMKESIRDLSNALNNGTYEELCQVVDINSMIDMYLLHELFKNSDVGWSSFFLYKKPNDSRIYFGPAWDFDLSTYRAKEQDRATSGKHISSKVLTSRPNYNECSGYNDIFVKATKLLDAEGKPGFENRLMERFTALRSNILVSISELTNGFDNHYLAFALNKKKWSTEAFDTYISKLMQWLIDRTKWMLANNFVK